MCPMIFFLLSRQCDLILDICFLGDKLDALCVRAFTDTNTFELFRQSDAHRLSVRFGVLWSFCDTNVLLLSNVDIASS